MATTPNEYTLKGKLQIVLEGCDGAIELGDVEIPVRLDFGQKPPQPDGLVWNGDPNVLNIINPSIPTGSVG